MDGDEEADLVEEEEIFVDGFAFFVNDDFRDMTSHMNCFLLKYG